MPKAEVGSTKYIANKQKSKGLQRLRWWCQICSKQCRDENGFKQHTLSESHVRAMLLVGEDPRKHIEDFSRQFQRDFLLLLRTSHGEKKVSMNQFYQEYIRDKEHVHMNATKWGSLTEFAKFLGREGICRVEEGERGLEISWVDDSAEAIRRREDVKRKERLAKGDEEVEARMLERQIKAAREQAERVEAERRARDGAGEDTELQTGSDAVSEPVKLSLALGSKTTQKQQPVKEQAEDAPVAITEFSAANTLPSSTSASKSKPAQSSTEGEPSSISTFAPADSAQPISTQAKPISLSLGAKAKVTNPLMAKKNPFSKKKDIVTSEPEKKISNAERIMREEMEAKRKAQERWGAGGSGLKRQRVE